MAWDGTSVVVTGGAGFIGSHVVDALVTAGARVTAVDDLSVGTVENLAGATATGARLEVGDVRDADFVRAACDGADIVIHMACSNLRASLAAPLVSHDVNATGTLVTALAARDAGVGRFVYVSSSEAYGSGECARIREDHGLRPTTVYGAAKAAGELYAIGVASAYGMPATIVRPFNAYGPRSHELGTSAEVIPRFARRIRAGLAPVIYGDGGQTRDFTWVTETAAGIVAAAACDELVGRAVNIAAGREVSIALVADTLLRLLGREDLGVVHEDARPGDVRRHWADVSLARAALGFQAEVTIEDGLARYVGWLDAGGAAADGRGGGERNW